mmetsp:Transcript_43263/g.41635  ORF Transcript_43263/g.41635 Transcript_43263/m.41635 type:complete len:537 (-) Transcript_43263:1351-2961(-)
MGHLGEEVLAVEEVLLLVVLDDEGAGLVVDPVGGRLQVLLLEGDVGDLVPLLEAQVHHDVLAVDQEGVVPVEDGHPPDLVQRQRHGPAVALVIELQVLLVGALEFDRTRLFEVSPDQRHPLACLDDLTLIIALVLGHQDGPLGLVVQHVRGTDDGHFRVDFVIGAGEGELCLHRELVDAPGVPPDLDVVGHSHHIDLEVVREALLPFLLNARHHLRFVRHKHHRVLQGALPCSRHLLVVVDPQLLVCVVYDDVLDEKGYQHSRILRVPHFEIHVQSLGSSHVLDLEELRGLLELCVLDQGLRPPKRLQPLVVVAHQGVQVQSEVEKYCLFKVEVVEHHFAALFNDKDLFLIQEVRFGFFLVLLLRFNSFFDDIGLDPEVTGECVLHDHWGLDVDAVGLGKGSLFLDDNAELLPVVEVGSGVFGESVDDGEDLDGVGPLVAGVGGVADGEPSVHVFHRDRVALPRLQRHDPLRGVPNELQLVVEAGHVLDGVRIPEGQDLPHVLKGHPVRYVVHPAVLEVVPVVLVVPQIHTSDHAI